MTVGKRYAGRKFLSREKFPINFRLTLVLAIFIFSAFEVRSAEISATLKWTAPADNNYQKCSSYEIRYSTRGPGEDITSWWNNATIAPNAPPPSDPGKKDSCIIGHLSHQNIYYFAIRSADRFYNWSKISNVVSFPNLSCADINSDDEFDILDIYCLLEYLFESGVTPQAGTGDVNNSGSIDIADIVELVNYKFRSGFPPCLAR